MKLLHFADVHLGMETYGRWDPESGLAARLMDFLVAFDCIVDRALNEKVDLAIFAGDAYKDRDPTPTYQREFASRILRLAEAGIAVVLVTGNHDLPRAAKRANTLEIFETLKVKNVHIASQIKAFALPLNSGTVQIIALPWIVPSHLLAREEYKELSLGEINLLITTMVENILANPKNGLISQLDRDLPTILTGHLTVQGAAWSSERSVMLGQEIVLPLSLLTHPAFDYVALGHIHKHQALNQRPPVVYSGSIERVDFGEEREQKGFILAEVQRGEAEWEFVPLPSRSFTTIEVTATGPDPTTQVLAAIGKQEIEGAIVRLIIHTTAEWEPRLRQAEIQQALGTSFHLSMIHDVERPLRSRLGSAAAQHFGPEELLLRYLESSGVSPERSKVLVKYAEGIFKDTEDQSGDRDGE